MQGYYVYKIYGTTEELKEFLVRLKELEGTDKCFDEFNHPDWQNTEYMKQERREPFIELGTYDGSCNVSSCRFSNIDYTMEKLSSAFPEYRIEAEGYYNDFAGTVETAFKETGTEEYTFEINSSDEDYYYAPLGNYNIEDDTIGLVHDEYGFADINVPADSFRDDDGKFDEIEYEFESEYGETSYATFTFSLGSSGAVVDDVENDINPIVFDMTNYDETKECFLFEEDDISFNVPAKYLKDEKGEFKSKQIVVENGGKKYSVYFMNEK